jgi:hypothetical protein
LNIKRYGQAVRDVLAGGRERRSLALVQDMTVKLWTVKADPRSREATYIATKTDRSPNILRDHASWLEADVKKDATARESAEQAKNVAQHTATARQREIDRCIATLKRQPDTGILGAACADAAAQLQADTFDAAAIDAWLLSIARTVVDQNELERLAREELAAWRPPKMSRDHYEHTIRTKVDRLLREHAKLPDLTVLAEYDGNRRPTSAAGM